MTFLEPSFQSHFIVVVVIVVVVDIFDIVVVFVIRNDSFVSSLCQVLFRWTNIL